MFSVQMVTTYQPLTWGLYTEPPADVPECGFLGELCPLPIKGWLSWSSHYVLFASNFAKCWLIFSASLSNSIASGALMLQTCRLAHLCVCLLVCKVYCDKTADWIRMSFGMVSGVGQGIRVLDWRWWSSKRRGSYGVNLGRAIVTNMAYATQIFSNYFDNLL